MSSDTFDGNKIIVEGNTLYDNYSRLISWATLKTAPVTMLIDEGKGIHFQGDATATGFTHGQILVDGNVVIRSGNAGITENGAERITISNNTLVDNGYINTLIAMGLADPLLPAGRTVNDGGIRLQSGTGIFIRDNIIRALAGTYALDPSNGLTTANVASQGNLVVGAVIANTRSALANGYSTSALGNAVVGTAGADVLSGGTGLDTADYTGASTWVMANLGNPGQNGGGATGDTYVGIENLTGTNIDGDFLTGDANDNVIYGRNGYNILDGGAGNDTLIGGTGPNFLYGGYGDDVLIGGDGPGVNSMFGFDGNDTLIGGNSGNSLDGEAGDDLILGGAGDDWLYGGDGNDVLVGYGGVNALFGGAGNDILYGGNDGNSLDGGDGADVIRGGTGTDWLYGGAGNDLLDASRGVNGVLFGGDGDDVLLGSNSGTLYGGDGNDTLTASTQGYTVLWGGAGNDTFNILAPTSIGGFAPQIMDFGDGIDVLTVSAAGFGLSFTGVLPAANFQSGAGLPASFAGTGPMFYFDTVGHGLWFDATGGGTADITLVAGFQTGSPTAATIRVV